MNFFIRMILIILSFCSLLENVFAAGGDDCPQILYYNDQPCDNKYTKSHCTALIKSSNCNSTSSQSDQFKLDETSSLFESEAQKTGGYAEREHIDQIIPKVQETQIQYGAIVKGYINPAFDEADPSESDTVPLLKEGHAVRPLQNDSYDSWMLTQSGKYLFDEDITYTNIDDILSQLQLPQGFPKSKSEIKQKIWICGKYIHNESDLGISVDKSRNIYIGRFKNGKIQDCGLGFYKKHKYLFIGNFLGGKVHGKGKQYYTNGDKYEGNFIEGLRYGRGKYYFTNGDRYEGNFVNGFRNGWGIAYFKDGSRYEGTFVNGLRSGWGIAYFTDGDRYEGTFVKDLKHGKGKMNYKNGKTETVFYFNNKQVSEREFNDLTTKSSWLPYFF